MKRLFANITLLQFTQLAYNPRNIQLQMLMIISHVILFIYLLYQQLLGRLPGKIMRTQLQTFLASQAFTTFS